MRQMKAASLKDQRSPQAQAMLRKKYKQHDYLINTHESLVEAGNDRLHVDERRYANTLKLTGSGTLVMGIWSLLKTFLNVFGEMGDELRAEEMPYFIAVFGVAIVFAVIFVIGISLRYIVWKGSRRESAGGRKRNGYIVCAVLLMAYGVYAFGRFIQKLAGKEIAEYDVAKLIFDITSFVILLELLISAFRLRKIRKEIADTGGKL